MTENWLGATEHNIPIEKGLLPMDDYTKANLDWWNEAAIVHSQGESYELASFKAGRTKLHSLELEEVGDVAGKKLLHLQCHFGLDTLSWARLGAQVTGPALRRVSPGAGERALSSWTSSVQFFEQK